MPSGKLSVVIHPILWGPSRLLCFPLVRHNLKLGSQIVQHQSLQVGIYLVSRSRTQAEVDTWEVRTILATMEPGLLRVPTVPRQVVIQPLVAGSLAAAAPFLLQVMALVSL